MYLVDCDVIFDPTRRKADENCSFIIVAFRNVGHARLDFCDAFSNSNNDALANDRRVVSSHRTNDTSEFTLQFFIPIFFFFIYFLESVPTKSNIIVCGCRNQYWRSPRAINRAKNVQLSEIDNICRGPTTTMVVL